MVCVWGGGVYKHILSLFGTLFGTLEDKWK